jgi:hypothetical protein
MLNRVARRPLLALWLALAAAPALAGAVSHVQVLARAGAPNSSDEQLKANQPYWAPAAYNSLSAVALAEGVDLATNRVKVVGLANGRADFSYVGASAQSQAAGVDYGGLPAATSSGDASAILQMDWTITGASGVFGTIYVSGSLFAGGSVDANALGAGSGAASSSVYAGLSKDGCFGAGCTDYSQLKVLLDGKENINGGATVGKNYTLAISVKPGDHVYLQYIATAMAGSGYGAWAGTAPDLSFPGDAPVSALSAEALAAGSASFAQRVWLSPGLDLSGAEGLTRLYDGSYGFGTPSVVPEPASAMLLLAGLAAVALRRRQGAV